MELLANYVANLLITLFALWFMTLTAVALYIHASQ
jgi:hypothetical protein